MSEGGGEDHHHQGKQELEQEEEDVLEDREEYMLLGFSNMSTFVRAVAMDGKRFSVLGLEDASGMSTVVFHTPGNVFQGRVEPTLGSVVVYGHGSSKAVCPPINRKVMLTLVDAQMVGDEHQGMQYDGDGGVDEEDMKDEGKRKKTRRPRSSTNKDKKKKKKKKEKEKDVEERNEDDVVASGDEEEPTKSSRSPPPESSSVVQEQLPAPREILVGEIQRGEREVEHDEAVEKRKRHEEEEEEQRKRLDAEEAERRTRQEEDEEEEKKEKEEQRKRRDVDEEARIRDIALESKNIQAAPMDDDVEAFKRATADEPPTEEAKSVRSKRGSARAPKKKGEEEAFALVVEKPATRGRKKQGQQEQQVIVDEVLDPEDMMEKQEVPQKKQKRGGQKKHEIPPPDTAKPNTRSRNKTQPPEIAGIKEEEEEKQPQQELPLPTYTKEELQQMSFQDLRRVRAKLDLDRSLLKKDEILDQILKHLGFL